jgi:formate dehydrogenase subunit gamma
MTASEASAPTLRPLPNRFPQAGKGTEGMRDRVTRHQLADRIYHWLMAAAVLILMGSAFLPIVGWKFEWLSLHWMTGVALAVLVLIHIVRALVWQDWRAMLPDAADLRDAWRNVRQVIHHNGPVAGKPGKYKILQKLYHLAIAVLVLSIVGSGLLMLLKIDTPLWRRNPYWFDSASWGVIYSVHGFASMALLTLVMVHIYFALRPEEWWLTRSMFRGYVSRREYDEHCDSSRWRLPDQA